MSKESMLNAISRVERIADMLPDCNERELNSLAGQASGALSAVVNELRSYGVNTNNPLLQKWGDRLVHGGNVEDAVHAFHIAAGFLRELIDGL